MKATQAAPHSRKGWPLVWTIIATSTALVVLNLTASPASAYCIMADGRACKRAEGGTMVQRQVP
jgi:hypothetical protein